MPQHSPRPKLNGDFGGADEECRNCHAQDQFLRRNGFAIERRSPGPLWRLGEYLYTQAEAMERALELENELAGEQVIPIERGRRKR